MSPIGVTVGERWCSKGSSTSYAEVLAELFMPLWVEVRFNEDVDLSFPGPVPVNDLPAKVGDIGVVQLVMGLNCPGLLLWTWV